MMPMYIPTEAPWKNSLLLRQNVFKASFNHEPVMFESFYISSSTAFYLDFYLYTFPYKDAQIFHTIVIVDCYCSKKLKFKERHEDFFHFVDFAVVHHGNSSSLMSFYSRHRIDRKNSSPHIWNCKFIFPSQSLSTLTYFFLTQSLMK